MSYQDKIRANKRAQFRERQQHNRIVDQLNRLRGAGRTTEEIQAAGTDAWYELGGQDIIKDPLTGQWQYKGGKPTNYTIADGDTLSTIADANKTTPENILAGNPNMNKIQTGMVINIPGSPGWQGAAITNGAPVSGGIGLPSNAALGGTTNNPQGANPYKFKVNQNSMAPGSIGQAARNPYIKPTFFQNLLGYDPNAYHAPNNPQLQSRLDKGGNFLSEAGHFWNKLIGKESFAPAKNSSGSPDDRNAGYTRPPQPTSPRVNPVTGQTAPFKNTFKSYSMLEENYHLRTLDRVLNTTNYTQDDINYLTKIGLIKPSTPPTSGGSFSGSYRRGGGGGRGRGGGGGGGGGGRTGQGPRRPAFSTGSQFTGLVNWRL